MELNGRNRTNNEQDWGRLNLIYFKSVVCIFGLPFSVAPFPLANMFPWLVILPLWSAGGWESTGRTGTWRSSWSNDIFWRVMGLFRNPNMIISLGKICPSSLFLPFLGPGNLPGLLEVNYGRVYPPCFNWIPMQYTIAQPDPTWSQWCNR
jgi:hypothetical protein